ncbi:helix-turn-helix transcriptional regulator [Pseudoduganella umbonata]|nr:LuxR family transcriptional regulator [Pseudoduganella umbonata]MBB3223611.1 LuxR family quorum-sensing transcriptional regulator LasR [Pseudoduganella umbonata]
MEEVPGSAGLMPGFFSPYDALMNAADEPDAVLRLQAAARELGFDNVMFAVIPQPKLNIGEVYLRSNYPDRWRDYYDRNNLRATDPTVEYCFRSSSPFVWLPQSFKTAEQQALYEEASAFGLKVGVTLPIRGVDGEIGMLTCVRDGNPGPDFLKDLNQNLGALALLRDVAFDSLHQYVHAAPPPAEAAPVLTARERDCLQWMCAGKTAWEIGRILSISEAGVNFHIANLRGKFGVSRRNDVVIKAIRLGLIDLPG